MNKSAANRLQIQLAKLGTRQPETWAAIVKVMASKPGYYVSGIILTNKHDREDIAIGKAEADTDTVTKL